MDNKLWSAGGAVVIIIGSALPWAKVSAGIFSREIGGLEGDGQVTAVLGVAVLVLALVNRRWSHLLAALTSLLAAGIGAYDFNNVMEAGRGDVSVSPGLGLILLVGGGIGAMVASFAARSDLQAEAVAVPPLVPGSPLPPPSV